MRGSGGLFACRVRLDGCSAREAAISQQGVASPWQSKAAELLQQAMSSRGLLLPDPVSFLCAGGLVFLVQGSPGTCRCSCPVSGAWLPSWCPALRLPEKADFSESMRASRNAQRSGSGRRIGWAFRPVIEQYRAKALRNVCLAHGLRCNGSLAQRHLAPK